MKQHALVTIFIIAFAVFFGAVSAVCDGELSIIGFIGIGGVSAGVFVGALRGAERAGGKKIWMR